MQLVGEVMGQISDALHKNSVPGFDETNVTNDWGRILLEAAGTAVVAGATGGNIGAATGSYVAGNILASATINAVAKWAVEQTNGDVKSATAITNIVENIIASAGGAIGGSSGALNGVGISSSVEQYNFVQAIPLIVEGLTYAYAIIKTWQAIEIANDVNNANQGNQDGSQVNNSANSSAQSTPADPNQQPDPDNDDKDNKQDQNNQQSSNDAKNNVNSSNLNAKLIGEEIAGGHAFEKHVLNQGEFTGLGIRTRAQFAELIENIVKNPTAVKNLGNGRTGYWDETTGTLVIRNPKGDGGTAFRPTTGRNYFDNKLN